MAQYLAFATDYDGTIADNGKVSAQTLAALKRLKATGRKLILVSGRVEDWFGKADAVKMTFPEIEIFDFAILENGAVLYVPSTKTWTLLAPSLPMAAIDTLNRSGMDRLWVGACTVASIREYDESISKILRACGMPYRREYNRNWVNFMPYGVSKANGLRHVLKICGIRPAQVVGAGDSFNDISFLRMCGKSAAVGDADAVVKKAADIVAPSAGSAGTREVLNSLINSDMRDWQVNQKDIA